ncbi:hypothetical protein GF373_15460 [bacterium]|nr:hypothetical protein [bacterium]
MEFQNGLGFPIHGFWEARGGIRGQSDPYIHDDPSIAESRLQLETERLLGPFVFTFMGDTYYDALMDEWEYDLRQLNATASPLDFLDVKVGRQILTWGTGDLFFINDMFPKDWQSFFIGRDVEYLKAPSDAVKMSLFTDWFNVNFVYTPQFDPDDYIRGERISYWNGGLGRRAGEDNPVRARTPDDFFTDDEMAFRIYRMIAAYEVAVYGYQGFWKSPGGSHPAGYAIFPELGVYGASVRGTVGPGIGNVEMGYYDSQDDADGDHPMIKNSEMRFLVGYEQEMAENFTVGGQYYVEWMQDYSDYKRVAPSNARLRDEDRHVLTLRLTKLLMQQDLTLSLFTFYSPSDQDTYLRPKVNYKVNDNWTVEAGSNIFIGQNNHTFFGQFEKNTNVYGSVRYSF